MAFFVPQQTSWGMIRVLLSKESFALRRRRQKREHIFPSVFYEPLSVRDVPPCGTPPVNVRRGTGAKQRRFTTLAFWPDRDVAEVIGLLATQCFPAPALPCPPAAPGRLLEVKRRD
jgi:hypothetical protein